MSQSVDSSSSLRDTRPLRSAGLRARDALRLELEGWLARLRFDDLEGAIPGEQVDARRSYMRLPTRSDSEAWLISWPAGSCAPLHDHGDAHGVAAVLSGELIELRYVHESQRWAEQRWTPGSIVELAPRTCHEVHNLSGATAYSLHVYAPRLASMTYYERTADGRIRPLRQEAAGEW